MTNRQPVTRLPESSDTIRAATMPLIEAAHLTAVMEVSIVNSLSERTSCRNCGKARPTI